MTASSLTNRVPIALLVLFGYAAAIPAGATTIDFEAQAAGAGGNLTGIPNSPLIIGIATFTGGELRKGEIGLTADQTGVYATEGLFGSGETNPLVITFASPVSNFGVLVVNDDNTGSYIVSDNLGDSVTKSLAAAGSGAAIFSLPGHSLTAVDITSADSNAWNFAIDNVTFATSTSAPEPGPVLLLMVGVMLLAALRATQVRAWLLKKVSGSSTRQSRDELT
jgi:hypothetical protein